MLEEQHIDCCPDSITVSSPHTAPVDQGQRRSLADDDPSCVRHLNKRGDDLMKLKLVTIVTAHLEQMRTFYQGVLQVEPQTYRGNYVEFALQAGTLALWRQSECEAFGLASMRGGANRSILIELEVEDVDGEYVRLKGLQMDWVQELTTQPWGHRAFYVRDPDGNVLNVHTTLEKPSG
jgi:uncharacterized glyoxalase superfamily protein PhnB